MTTYQHDQWLDLLSERFGKDPMNWAFTCPSCEDVATGADFRAALAERPSTRKDGSTRIASDLLGQECIGRTLGALTMTDTAYSKEVEAGRTRGCSWCAYGLFRGPDVVQYSVNGETKDMFCFPIAPAKETSNA